MANAKDAETKVPPRLLLTGELGSGKTTQFLTFPGKRFAYIFDPNSLRSLQGYDVEYEAFMPDRPSVSLTSLSGEVNKALRAQGLIKNNMHGAEVYRRWEADFEKRLSDGFFNSVDAILFDSVTTLLDLIMDGVVALNGRPGQWPREDDYAPQMLAMRNIARTVTSLEIPVLFTGHLDRKQDRTTGMIVQAPLMTGRLKTFIPILFTDVWIAEANTDAKGVTKYQVQTKPGGLNKTIRSSNRNLSAFEDVTLDFNKPLEGQGVARLLQFGGKA